MTIHSIIPLSLLEAVQEADADTEAVVVRELPEDEGRVRRLGRSASVAAEIKRYREHPGRGVKTADVTALIRLIARRADRSLVLANAGRKAGRLAAKPLKDGVVSGFRRRRGVAERIAGRIFDIHSDRSGQGYRWRDAAGLASNGQSAGVCEMYGVAVAELLRLFTGFEGALYHTKCRFRSDGECVWSREAEDAPPGQAGLDAR